MRAWAISLGVVIQLGAALPAHALDSHRRVTQYGQTHYEKRDGLPHGLANSIAQTSDGYLWAGSEEGLSRFDGAGFTTFDHRNTDRLPTNIFTALAVDAAGTLWAGTHEHGLLHRSGGEFFPVAWEPGPQEQQIRALVFDAGGDLWVGMHDRGVVRLHAGALVAALTTRDGLPCDDVRSFLAARDGSMWIGTFRGLAQWKAGRLSRGPAALDDIVIHAIAQDARGELWFATSRGLAHLRGDAGNAGNAIEWVGADRLLTSDVRRVLFDRDGNLWIGAATGVARMTPSGQIDRLAHPAAMIMALFEDAEGNLWVGSETGLDRLRDGDVIPLGAPEGITDENAFGVREDASGAMWITTSSGLFRIAPGETSAQKLASDRGTMYAIYPDARGDVWFSSRDGDVGRWRGGQFAWLGHQSWERIRSISQTADGMWFGTEHGLFRLRSDRLEDAEPIVPGIVVSAIAPDTGGVLWLATDSGLMRWRAGAPAPVPPGGPPRNTQVSTITFDPDGTMWVGTEGAGLWRLRDGRWFVFTSKDGMFDDLVWRILDDGLGNLWMSSNRGIWRVSRDQLEARAAGQRLTVDSVLYGEADGMRDRECNGAIDPAGWRTHDGRLWFPTGKGLVAIDPGHLHAAPPPSALVESLRVDGQPMRLTAAVELAPGASRLEIGYTAPALRGPERLRFRYRLDGFDPGWNDVGAQRLAQYTNLAPGEYRFVVEAGLDGAWGKAGSLAVTLEPAFYQNGWFYALAILSIALAIIAVPMLRVRQLRARAKELDRRVQEAVRELKVLSGLLPICAWCKKVRDDHGYWSQIDAYLAARTDTQVTHGICPDCNDKLLAEDSTLRRAQHR